MNLKDFFLKEQHGDANISIIDAILEVSITGRSKTIKFRSGEKTKVDRLNAELLATAYTAMNSSQQTKFDNFISKDKKNYNITLQAIYRKLK